MKSNFWKNRRVLVTGHTGFKGSWLSIWLHSLGAYVYGYALKPKSEHGIYAATGLTKILHGEVLADIRSSSSLGNALREFKPEVILHLAAQPIVKASYSDPTETFSVNVMGLISLLEQTRHVDTIKCIVNVTTDKCYLNEELGWPFRENEKLGGRDPYSASKACAEIISACYKHSFLDALNIHIATARAGNVIGGGDYAVDRLVPDFLRCLDNDQELVLRNPEATRPWQHVLEPVSGYIQLAERLVIDGKDFAEAWNFGPDFDDNVMVQDLVKLMISLRNRGRWKISKCNHVYEAQSLSLDSYKSKKYLGWRPRWRLDSALNKTIEWHEANLERKDMLDLSLQQIQEYEHS